jgi:hypothetical protein
MTMTGEIPLELQSLVATAVARGRFANEQEWVADMLLLVIHRPRADGIVVILVTHGYRDLRTVVEQIFGPSGSDD